MTLPTSSFPPLDTSYLEEVILHYEDGIYPSDHVSEIGNFDNTDQKNALKLSISFNNYKTYLEDYIDFDEFNVLYSGGIPSFASTTFGLLRGNTGSDKFNLESLQDYNDPSDETVKGKFNTKSEFESAQQLSNLDYYYSSFSYMEMSDGVQAPVRRDVNMTHFGLDDVVVVETHSSAENFNRPNYSPTNIPENTSDSGGSVFDPDYFNPDRYPTGPSDDYKSPSSPSGQSGDNNQDDQDQDDDTGNFDMMPPPQTATLFISSAPSN